MQISAQSSIGLKIAGGRERQACLGRRSEVRGASCQTRNIGSNDVQNFGGRVASGTSLGIGGENRNVFRRIRGQLSLLNLVELRCGLGEFLPVLRELLLPFLARFAASPPNAGFEVFIHPVGYKKLGVWRPAISLLGELDLFFTERLALHPTRVLTMLRTIAHMAVDHYEGRPAPRARGIPP